MPADCSIPKRFRMGNLQFPCTASAIDPADWQPTCFPCLDIVGVPVINTTRARITQELIAYSRAPFRRCRTLFFLNAYGCNLTFADARYARALENATWVLNDGFGMDIAARLQGRTFAENLNGSDLIDEGEFLHLCARNGLRIFLLGAPQATLDLARSRYRELFPGLQIAGSHHGYFAHADEGASRSVVDLINASGAEVLLVGMGNPLQEFWLDRYRAVLRCRLAIGYGGSLDQVSGVIPRAPRAWIHLHLEWLFRFLQEPSRLWRRYLIGNPLFVARVMLHRKGLYGRPDRGYDAHPQVDPAGNRPRPPGHR